MGESAAAPSELRGRGGTKNDEMTAKNAKRDDADEILNNGNFSSAPSAFRGSLLLFDRAWDLTMQAIDRKQLVRQSSQVKVGQAIVPMFFDIKGKQEIAVNRAKSRFGLKIHGAGTKFVNYNYGQMGVTLAKK